MAVADMVVDDTARGPRNLNAAAINAMLVANPSALTAAAIASALAGGGQPGVFAGITNTGGMNSTPTVVAAAGATQGNAGAIGANSGQDIVVTVTASTEGVRLPPTVAGTRKNIWAAPAVGAKLYPATGSIIGAAATNVAKAVPKNTMLAVYAVDATHWRISV